MYKKPDFQPSRSEMLEILERNIRPVGKYETSALSASAGRICAEDIRASYDLPNRPVSSCDGISVRFGDFSGGTPDTRLWAEGRNYRFSNTGVAIDEAFDTVIPIECVSFDENGAISLSDFPKKSGELVGPVGSQIKKGEILAHRGEPISPALMGILLSAGVTNVRVLSKPKVVFIPTGDELVPAGFELPAGKNVESNSLMLKAYLEQWGAQALISPIVPDVMERLRAAILSAAKGADLVLICAGSSKGSRDYTIELLESLGKVYVYELGHGPGKHCSLANIGGVPVMGLPGPPNGADLTSALYVKNAVRLMLMQPVQLPYTIQAVLTADLRMFDGMDFMPYLAVFRKDGKYFARPAEMRGNTRAGLYHAHNARCYIERNTCYRAGQTINAEMCVSKEYIPEEK